MPSINQFFKEHGYFYARSVYLPSELAAMSKEFDRILVQIQTADENIDATWRGAASREILTKEAKIFHTHNVQQYSSVWLNAIQQKQFLDIGEQILGEDIILHHTKLFYKPQEQGSPFPVHQDWSYFPTHKDSMIAAIIHISDATDEMGCLRVYPGSHRLGRVKNTSGQTKVTAKLLKEYPLEEAKIIEARAGDVVFFHYFTLHGSMPNRSDADRKTVLVQMYSGKDAVEKENRHPNEKLALRGWNYCASRESAGGRRIRSG